jgi:hypothetical protein
MANNVKQLLYMCCLNISYHSSIVKELTVALWLFGSASVAIVTVPPIAMEVDFGTDWHQSDGS